MEIYPATPFGLPDTAPELARRFAMIMAGLGALVARRFLKMPHLARFTMQLWTYLNRATRRFHRALTRRVGKVRAPRARVACAEVERVRQVSLPSGRGWIVRELGWEAAAYMLHLEVLLGEIATRAALADAPGAGRILRPICRMLGVAMPVVAAPVVLASAEAVVDLGVAEVPPDTLPSAWPKVDGVGSPREASGDCLGLATCG